jgi:crotonobetainyl-CoA:carnitine CoA-transferase CaiB-like acyl-CoA transferase
MEWMHEEGFCDTATRDKDWIGLLTQLLTGQESLSEYDRLKRLVGEFTITKSKAELIREALARGLLIAPVTTIGEVADSEQLAERDYWRLLDHPELGRSFRYPGPFAKFGRTPITYRHRPPTVGEHNDAVYRDALGLSAEEIANLRGRGVI